VSRFYVPAESVKGKQLIIGGDEAHHIIDVMRLKPSDTVVAFDGTGREYTGSIRSVSKGSVVIDILNTAESVSRAAERITLIQAIPKKAKMDYIVEKATELGVSAVVPVVTERTIPEWDEPKRASCVRRWRKIALEASKQSSRIDIPSVSDIIDFKAYVKVAAIDGLAIIPTLGGKVIGLREALRGRRGRPVTVAIGPEGDFTQGEVDTARLAGFKPVSLGPRVLKSDTAGLAALAILGYELTDDGK
jgi:16S rRNA (uracil1498-N3)-methyltransferase